MVIQLPFSLRNVMQSAYPQLYIELGDEFALQAYVDTGAEWTLLHFDLASILKIDLGAGEPLKIQTRWGELNTFIHPISITLLGDDQTGLRLEQCKVAFDSGVSGTFSQQKEKQAFVGRTDFLNRLSLCVHWLREVYVEPKIGDANIMRVNVDANSNRA